MEVQADNFIKSNSTQMSNLTLDSPLNCPIDIPSDDEESTGMSDTSVSTNKTLMAKNTTSWTTWLYTASEISRHKLVVSPANLISDWWKNFQIFHCKHINKLYIVRCRYCRKKVKIRRIV